MNNNLYIHPHIKKPLILFIAVIIAAIALVAVSDRYREHAYEGRQSENRAMQLWKNKIDGSRESNRIIDQYESDYLVLVSDNIVGKENRLNWLEIIQETANAKGLLSVKYNVSSQRRVEDKIGRHSAQGLEIYRSQMTLEMEMAHEGGLFLMLNTLHEKAQGLFTVDKCIIEKTGKKLNNIDEKIHAYCDLSWYSFKSAEKWSQQ